MPVTLRHYQNTAHEEVRKAFLKATTPRDWRQLVVLPTGCGKTVTGLAMAERVIKKGGRVLWMAHRKELILQPRDTWGRLWPEHAKIGGVVMAGQSADRARIVFASAQTIQSRRRFARLIEAGPFDAVFADEAHHYADGTGYFNTLRRVEKDRIARKRRPPYVVGLTATPYRADRKPIGNDWATAYCYPIEHAWDEGFLVPLADPPREWANSRGNAILDRLQVDLSEVRILKSGDYDEKELEDALIEQGMVDHTVVAIQRHARGRRTILVFTVTVRQATLTAKALTEAGIRAAVISGETPDGERKAVLEALAAGRIPVVCNANVLTEGTDIVEIDCIVYARPTQSKGLFVQIGGRGLRPAPHTGKKDCLIIDLVGATEQHSFTMSGAPLEGEEEEDGQQKLTSDGGDGSGGASLYGGLLKKRQRVEHTWLEVTGVDRRAMCLSAGSQGDVGIVENPDTGRWRAILFRRSGVIQQLYHGETTQSYAMESGEDAVQNAIGGKDQGWRFGPPQNKHVRWLGRQGLWARNAGHAEDLMTAANVRSKLIHHGLAHRVDAPTQLQLGVG